jgi:hypothetical protein
MIKKQTFKICKMRSSVSLPSVCMCVFLQGRTTGPVIAQGPVSHHPYPGAQWRGGLSTSIDALLCDDGSGKIRDDSATTLRPGRWRGRRAASCPSTRRSRLLNRKLLLISLGTTKNRYDTVGLSFLEEKRIVHFDFFFSTLSSSTIFPCGYEEITE